MNEIQPSQFMNEKLDDLEQARDLLIKNIVTGELLYGLADTSDDTPPDSVDSYTLFILHFLGCTPVVRDEVTNSHRIISLEEVRSSIDYDRINFEELAAFLVSSYTNRIIGIMKPVSLPENDAQWEQYTIAKTLEEELARTSFNTETFEIIKKAVTDAGIEQDEDIQSALADLYVATIAMGKNKI